MSQLSLIEPPMFSHCEILINGKWRKATFWKRSFNVEWSVVEMKDVEKWIVINPDPYDSEEVRAVSKVS